MDVVDIADLDDPVEVWKAVEGEFADLLALLRSSRPLTPRTREALADWLEGKLQPVKLPRGRPSKSFSGALAQLYYGHDPSTSLGRAGLHYEVCRRFIRAKGWHLKKAGRLHWSAERLREKVSERHQVDLEAFANYLSRQKAKPRPRAVGDYVDRRRQQIAREIHRTKMGEKG